MRLTRMTFLVLVWLMPFVVAGGAGADLLEWKKTKFDVIGPSPPVAQTMEELRGIFADPLVCSGCHPRHHDAWSKSFHARSIASPGFQALYLKYLDFLKLAETEKMLGRPASAQELRQCLFCHAPQVQFASDELVQRLSDAIAAGRWDETRGAQISCVACHALNPERKWASASFSGRGVMYGPLRDPTPESIHKSKYSRLHTRSEFCGTCHSVATFNVYCSLVYEEQKEADPAGKIQCQDCHMKGKEKVPVAVAAKKKRTLHDHTSPGGRFDRMWDEAIDLALRTERQADGDIRVTVNVKNMITHNIPDG